MNTVGSVAPRLSLENTGMMDSKDITREQWKATRMMNSAMAWCEYM